MDAGFTFPIPFEIDTKQVVQRPLNISVGTNSSFGEGGVIGIYARADAFFAGSFTNDGKKTYEAPFEVNFHIKPSYKLSFATVGLDFGLYAASESKSGNDLAYKTDGGAQVGFGAWILKAYGGGSIQAGLAYRAQANAIESAGDAKDTKRPGVFSIPIVFDYSF
ncbi:hypothetical protein AGMMS49546_39700 [Spirochaetia bacterium]|nr:hypothetical protein AGMMS49546_39700 [Spirochaetia bacterium]